MAIALGYADCQQRHSVLFVTAVEVIHRVVAAQAAHSLPDALKRQT